MPLAHVVAVEAAADNAALLRRNLEAFADRTTIIEGAVAAHGGIGRFRAAGHSWQRGLADDPGMPGTVDVRCLTMPDVMAQAGIDRIDLLKVDIEGAEAMLFEGGPSWLSAVGMIVIEVHEPYSLEAFAHAVGRAGFTTLAPDAGWGNRMPMALSPSAAGWTGSERFPKEHRYGLA
jgi:FkbM family methyltransferase